MNLHEYQSKRIFGQFGIPVPKGEVATTPAEVRDIAVRLGVPVVVKSQVLVGGRGKAGGIKVAKTLDDAERHADNILGMLIKGLKVRKVLVDPAANIVKEIYLGAVLDRANRRVVMMASSEGGIDIEEVAARLLVALYGKRRRPRVAGLGGLVLRLVGRRRRFICERCNHRHTARRGDGVKRTKDVCLTCRIGMQRSLAGSKQGGIAAIGAGIDDLRVLVGQHRCQCRHNCIDGQIRLCPRRRRGIHGRRLAHRVRLAGDEQIGHLALLLWRQPGEFSQLGYIVVQRRPDQRAAHVRVKGEQHRRVAHIVGLTPQHQVGGQALLARLHARQFQQLAGAVGQFAAGEPVFQVGVEVARNLQALLGAALGETHFARNSGSCTGNG